MHAPYFHSEDDKDNKDGGNDWDDAITSVFHLNLWTERILQLTSNLTESQCKLDV